MAASAINRTGANLISALLAEMAGSSSGISPVYAGIALSNAISDKNTQRQCPSHTDIDGVTDARYCAILDSSELCSLPVLFRS